MYGGNNSEIETHMRLINNLRKMSKLHKPKVKTCKVLKNWAKRDIMLNDKLFCTPLKASKLFGGVSLRVIIRGMKIARIIIYQPHSYLI